MTTAPYAQPRASSLWLFVALAAASIILMQQANGVFPGDHGLALAGRLLGMVAGLALLIAGSRKLLARDGLAPEILGLGITGGHAVAALQGALLAFAFMAGLLALLYLVAPFDLGTGPKPLSSVPMAAVNYLLGNAGEELVFRGYLLIVLARWLGTARAVLLLALPFALMHIPGLDTLSAAKMMMTTGAMHLVFAAVFLMTRTLWAAMAMHAMANTLLHAVLGTDTPGVLALRFTNKLPGSVDLLFLVFLGSALLMALVLARLPATRRGAQALESRG